ncbi:MAG: hypothetical protein SPE13_07030 [Alloprevotella sp.]|nr:hypothetical protein [Alloprevotella sp.]
MRKPSVKKAFMARTKGYGTRIIKRAIIPWYGKRGMGWVHPMRAIYNRIYYRLTFSIFDLFKSDAPRQRRRRTVAPAGSSTHQGAFDGCLEFLILLLIAAAIIFFL